MKALIAFIVIVLLVLFAFVLDAHGYQTRELVAAVIVLEAGNQSKTGMIAVCNSIYNREAMPRWWGTTAREIVLKPSQYSCLNDISPESAIRIAKNHAAWDTAYAIAVLGEAGLLPDASGGATHYYNPKKARPSWAKKIKYIKTIGEHRFYREEAR